MKIIIEIFYFFNLFNFELFFRKFKLDYLSIDKLYLILSIEDLIFLFIFKSIYKDQVQILKIILYKLIKSSKVFIFWILFQKSPILFLANNLVFLLYSFMFYLYNLAASTFAGESRFGSTNIEVILIITASIVNIGFHFYSTFY